MRRLEPLSTGQRIDAWVVLDCIGFGGTASVYRVRHEQLGLVAALKVVAVPSRAIMERLRAEGRVMSRVRHRNIVGVRDVLDVDGSPGLLMDWIAGPTLDQLLTLVPLELTDIDALARGILRGMVAVHEAGLIHRDLKPSNILVAVEDEVLVPKVADFGLAKDLVGGQGTTRTGAMFGTPSYMSPEQIRDPKSVDVRSDVFSLGSVLYEMVAGIQAFGGEDVLDVLTRIAEGRVTPIRDRRPDLPARMVDTIEAAMRVDRDRRPPNVQALLARWTAGIPEPAPRRIDPGQLAQVQALVSTPPSVASANETHAPSIPAPARSSASTSVARFAVAGMLGSSALAAVFACAGFGGIVAYGLSAGGPPGSTALTSAPTDAPGLAVAIDPGEAPLAATEALPDPVEPDAVEPDPVEPHPVEPEPIEPAPAPRSTARAPAPQVQPPVETAPVEVVPAPAAPTVGEVRVTGHVRSVSLRDPTGHMRVAGADVPPGTYTVLALFGEDAQPIVTGQIRVDAGAVVQVRCEMRKCQVVR